MVKAYEVLFCYPLHRLCVPLGYPGSGVCSLLSLGLFGVGGARGDTLHHTD